MLRIKSQFNNNYIHSFVLFFYFNLQGCPMDHLSRLEKRIRKNFPDISEQELKERMAIAKGLIAIAHQQKKTLKGLKKPPERFKSHENDCSNPITEKFHMIAEEF